MQGGWLSWTLASRRKGRLAAWPRDDRRIGQILHGEKDLVGAEEASISEASTKYSLSASWFIAQDSSVPRYVFMDNMNSSSLVKSRLEMRAVGSRALPSSTRSFATCQPHRDAVFPGTRPAGLAGWRLTTGFATAGWSELGRVCRACGRCVIVQWWLTTVC